ncbi:hypothetical protein BH10PSE12_BH10PSE12_07960 [soil metagenome]
MERNSGCVEEALALMRDALALLDRAGAGATPYACHLSMAIDVAEGHPVASNEEACRRVVLEEARSDGARPAQRHSGNPL